MTNKEAIERIKSYKRYLMGGNPIWSVEEVAEAFDMAIESLSTDGDLISRIQAQKVLGELADENAPSRTEHKEFQKGVYNGVLQAKILIADLPSADRPKGEWIYNDKQGTFKIYTCSECGLNMETEWDFCPNCGAEMRKENDDGCS